MTYTPPVDGAAFLLRHVVGMEELAGHKQFAEASTDMVDAIVEGAGAVRRGRCSRR